MILQTSEGSIEIKLNVSNEVRQLAGSCNERELLAMILLELKQVKHACEPLTIDREKLKEIVNSQKFKNERTG